MCYICSLCSFKIGSNHAALTLARVDTQQVVLFQPTHHESLERKGMGVGLNETTGISQYKTWGEKSFPPL